MNSGGCYVVGCGLSGWVLLREVRNWMVMVGDKLVERILFCMVERLIELWMCEFVGGVWEGWSGFYIDYIEVVEEGVVSCDGGVFEIN